MKIMVVGSGGREHALIQKLAQSPKVTTIYALPGNGGMTSDAVCVPIGATDLDAIVDFSQTEGIDFAVVAPDDPLCLGLVDRLEAVGIRAFGPRKNAAILEGSKAFAKDLMRRYHIPTAEYAVYTRAADALEAVCAKGFRFPCVIKADGLALGKGVLICENLSDAKAAIADIMETKVFGAAGEKIVIEEFLTGPEVSVLCFTDSETLKPMVSSMDHKRALDNDQGLNTGGMGTIAPNPFYTPTVAERCMESIFLPTIRAMQAEGRPFNGCLYFGLMLTPDGPKVIEYNCRFGDPETQVVLPLLESDLLAIMEACVDSTLAETPVVFSTGCACCVIAASGGYPEAYEKGLPISIKPCDGDLFFAGVALENDALVTAGGRVLGVAATAETLPQAIEKAYKAVTSVSFAGMHYRRDIGKRAMEAMEKQV